MSRDYVIVTGLGSTSRALHSAADRIGLQRVLTSECASAFVSADTPVLKLPGHAVIIGDLFTLRGTRVQGSVPLPGPMGRGEIQAYLLSHYWGEYVLVQVDVAQDAVTVMSEPSGAKRCVYSLDRGSGFVTSDITLAERLNLYRRKLDWSYISYFLFYPNHKTRRTAFHGIFELLPGCALRIRGDHTRTDCAWSPWDFVSPKRRFTRFEEAAAAIRSSVSTVVRAWADTDGSVLLELSGGLDSSIVAACLAGSNTDTSLCNLTTPIRGTDEQRYAALVAQHLGAGLHTEVLAVEAANICFEPPAASVVPCVTALQHATDALLRSAGEAKGVSSYFSGAGGDSAFCYLSTAAPAADAILERGFLHGAAAVRDLSRMHDCTLWRGWRLSLRKLRATAPPPRPDMLFVDPGVAAPPPETHPWFSGPAGSLPGDREHIIGLAGTQPFRDAIPRSMRRPLRMPFLTQPVMECCLRAPTWMWIHGGINRAVARAAFSASLPQEILQRRSKGSFIAYTGAAFEQNRSHIREFLNNGRLHEQQLLDLDALNSVLDDGRRAYSGSLQRIFDLCMVENWVRHQP